MITSSTGKDHDDEQPKKRVESASINRPETVEIGGQRKKGEWRGVEDPNYCSPAFLLRTNFEGRLEIDQAPHGK